MLFSYSEQKKRVLVKYKLFCAVNRRMSPYREQPQSLQSITFAILADHYYSRRGVKMEIADFPAVRMGNFFSALKQDIDNYAIVVKNALCALIRTQPRCQYTPTVYFCKFSDKFQPQWLCFLNILHALLQLLDRKKQAEAWTRACELWRYTISTIVTIEFFHHGNLNLCSSCQLWHYWGKPGRTLRHGCCDIVLSRDEPALYTRLYLYRKYIVASACEGDSPVNLVFSQVVGDTMTDMLFTDPLFNGRRIAVAKVTLTKKLFNIQIGLHDRCMHLYYPLKEDGQVLRYRKFYSKLSGLWEKEAYYYCGASYDMYKVFKRQPEDHNMPDVCKPIDLVGATGNPNTIADLSLFATNNVHNSHSCSFTLP